MTDDALFCHRCGAALTPGAGDFYVVRIEAFADPTPGTMDSQGRDLRAEIEQLIEQMRDKSEQELLDDVHRRLTIHLCRPCYLAWIENPAG